MFSAASHSAQALVTVLPPLWFAVCHCHAQTSAPRAHRSADTHACLISHVLIVSPWKRDVQFPSPLSGQLASFRKRARWQTLSVHGCPHQRVLSARSKEAVQGKTRRIQRVHVPWAWMVVCKLSLFLHFKVVLNVQPLIGSLRKTNNLTENCRLVWRRKIEIVIPPNYRGHSLNIWCRRIDVHSSGTNWIGV